MLGETLRRLRGIYGYSAKEMSYKLGISNSYLSEIERGKKSPTLELLTSYSEIFGIRVSSLMRFSEQFDCAEKHGAGQEFITGLMSKLINTFEVKE